MNEELSVKSNDELTIKSPIEPNNIVFTFGGGEEIIRINSDGFFWKGKLVQDDNEIYQRFKEWLDGARAINEKKFEPQPKKFNSIEEYENLTGLLEQALKFYANDTTYEKVTKIGDREVSPIMYDRGYQAKFALDKIREIKLVVQQIEEDYDKIVRTYELLQNSESPADIQKLMNEFKIMTDDKEL